MSINFPKDTWRRVERWWSPPYNDRREWTLGGKDFSVSFWFHPKREGEHAMDVIAGIEFHYHCHEGPYVTRCINSPTGFCSRDGTSLGGSELYAYVCAYGEEQVDEDAIWCRLLLWYEERSRDIKTPADRTEELRTEDA